MQRARKAQLNLLTVTVYASQRYAEPARTDLLRLQFGAKLPQRSLDTRHDIPDQADGFGQGQAHAVMGWLRQADLLGLVPGPDPAASARRGQNGGSEARAALRPVR